jgi:preprotein translocase subunit SecA
LNHNQIRELTEGAGPELKEELREQIADQLKSLEFKRMVGAVERLLGASLEIEDDQLEKLDWDSVDSWIADRVRQLFDDRRNQFFRDPEDARVIKSIEVGLRDVEGDQLSTSDLIRILGLMAEGRRAAFDKKSHKRIWLRTQRMRYPFFAGELLQRYAPEEVEGEILQHLEQARSAIQDAYGGNEMVRLQDQKLSSVEEDLRDLLKTQLGEETFRRSMDLEIGKLPPDITDQVQDQLGRFLLSNVYRDLFLRVISELWVEYLTEMEALRVAIGLEAYAQRDPLVQYKTRGFEMFQHLMEDMRVGVVNRMFTFQPRNLERIQTSVETA